MTVSETLRSSFKCQRHRLTALEGGTGRHWDTAQLLLRHITANFWLRGNKGP
jgi:hypothetical protein